MRIRASHHETIVHLFCCNLTFLQHFPYYYVNWRQSYLATPRPSQFALPLQVAAICYRVRENGVQFLLVKTRGGSKWTFPKGDPDRSLTHSQAAEREAWEEAGVHGMIEGKHFHLYLHSKGVFWKPSGIREYVVKAFLLEVDEVGDSHEDDRNPTWFSADDARNILAKGRQAKYAKEIQAVVDRALHHIQALATVPSQKTQKDFLSRA